MEERVSEAKNKLEFKDFHFELKEFDGWSLKHKHQATEIYILMSGEHDIYVENRQYHLKRGDVCLIGSGVTHAYIAEGKYSRYEISFRPKFIDMFFAPDFRRMLMKCFTSEIIHLSEEELVRFCTLYKQMEYEWQCGGIYPLYFANIMNLLDKAGERQLENPILPQFATKELTALTNAVTYINAHYRSIKSIDEIAEACFSSKSYLCHVFKEEYGMTVMDYLKRVRIRHACEFLATSDKTFTLIASKMGFADISHFTKNFKKIMGCSPREYRESKKKELAEKKE